MESSKIQWLNEDFLLEVLQQRESGRIKIKTFSMSSAVGAGNNYLSKIFRVQIEYTVEAREKTTSLIIKVPIASGFIVETEKCMLDTEPIIYTKVLPKMFDNTGYQFGPVFYNSSQPSAMILQDLKQDGYSMCDKLKRLDVPHCKAVVENIAKFHACSVLIAKEDPELINIVGKEKMYSHEDPMIEQKRTWLKESVQGVAQIISSVGGSNECAELFINRSEPLANSIENICKAKQTGLNVLNHGDLWVNNIMFKNENKDIKVKLIDFQITRYASPVLDLLYFIWTSADLEVCSNHLKELFHVYITTLNETLEQIGCEERMTEEEFKNDLKNCADYTFVILCGYLPFMLCDADNAVNFEDIKSEDLLNGNVKEKFQKVYSGKHLISILPSLVSHLNTWLVELNLETQH